MWQEIFFSKLNDRNMHRKIENGLKVSVEKLLGLHPFFLTLATEKEIAICLCKLCLNIRLLFDPVVAKANKDENTCNSITEYLMINCLCVKGKRGGTAEL